MAEDPAARPRAIAVSLVVAMYLTAVLWIILFLAIASVAGGVWYIRTQRRAPETST